MSAETPPIANTPAARPAGSCCARRGEPAGERRRQLQLVDAEHRQRQRHQAEREGAEHPRVLQGRGEALAGQAGGDAERGVDDGHAERVGGGEREAAAARHAGRRAAPRRARAGERRRAALPAWPTMIDETIGSIGSTHGVSDSSRPATKKAPTIDQNAPPRSTDSIAPSSPPAAVDGAGSSSIARRRAAARGRTRRRRRRDDAAAAEAGQADARRRSASADSTGPRRRSPGW